MISQPIFELVVFPASQPLLLSSTVNYLSKLIEYNLLMIDNDIPFPTTTPHTPQT